MARKRATNGSGTIRQRNDGRWEAIYTVGRDNGSGKLIRKSVYGATSEEAAKKLRAATAAIDNGTYVEPEKMQLKQWLSIWLTEYTGSIKPGTLITYESNVRLHINPALGAVKLSDLKPHNLQTFVNRLYRGVPGSHALSAKMVKNIHGTLHNALETAVKIGYLRLNPSSNIELPRVERKEIRPLGGQQIDSFLKAINGNPFEPLFFTALYTGMRLSELLGLQWACVDFNNETIKIDKQLLVKRGAETQRTFGAPKNDKVRVIKVASSVMTVLKRVKVQQTENRLKVGEIWVNELGLVFTNEIGVNLPHATVEHRFKRIVTSIGLSECRFHDLRHTYATEGIRLGIPVKTISEALGHYSTAFTMDVYGHTTEQMQIDAAAIFEQTILERKRYG